MKKKVIIFTVVFFLLGSISGVNIWIFNDLPDVESIEDYEPLLTTRIYDIHNELIDEIYQQRRIPVALDSLPHFIVDAAVAVEDKEFYEHFGINIGRIFKAILVDIIKGGYVQGASTITQQLSRNIFLSLRKTILRKIKEIYLAILIERHYSKDKIMEMYLNEIYFGYGNYGIEAAAEYYFDKSVDTISLSEGAALIGLIRSPGYYSPYNDYNRFVQRKNFVLRELQADGYIKEKELESALGETLEVSDHSGDSRTGPYYINEVRKKMRALFGSASRTSGGYKIYTCMDKKMQVLADSIIEFGLKRVEKIWHLTPRDSISDSLIFADNIPYIQGSMVVMEPSTGYVLALVGGRDFNDSRYNRAVQSRRQAGSSFKPFLYTAAIDNGFSPSDFVLDLPIIKEIQGRTYAPANYDSTFMGKIPLRTALSKSRNSAAVRLTQEVGPFTVVDYAHRLGIESYLEPVLSIPLGTSGVTLLEMVRAYSTLANYGVKVKPLFIRKVEDRYGNVVYENREVKEKVISEESAYLVVDMLQSVFNEGTAYGARRRGFELPAAGKTGTTDNFTDAWFIGFIPGLTTGVWVGYDYPKRIGNHASGAGVALPMWVDFMESIADSTVNYKFTQPDGVVHRYVCVESGQLATQRCPEVREEVFKRSNAPSRRCKLHSKSVSEENETIEMMDKFQF